MVLIDRFKQLSPAELLQCEPTESPQTIRLSRSEVVSLEWRDATDASVQRNADLLGRFWKHRGEENSKTTITVGSLAVAAFALVVTILSKIFVWDKIAEGQGDPWDLWFPVIVICAAVIAVLLVLLYALRKGKRYIAASEYLRFFAAEGKSQEEPAAVRSADGGVSLARASSAG